MDLAALRVFRAVADEGLVTRAAERLNTVQSNVTARIRQLEDMLRKAEVGETPPDDGVVEPGMVVTFKFKGDADDEADENAEDGAA